MDIIYIVKVEIVNFLEFPKEDYIVSTRSEEREVLEGGSILVAMFPSCQYMRLLHHNCIDMNIFG